MKTGRKGNHRPGYTGIAGAGKWKRLFFSFFLPGVLMSMLFAVRAAAAPADSFPALDAKGSISLTVLDGRTKAPVAGGNLKLYQVAAVRAKDGGYHFSYTDAFAGAKSSYDISAMTLEDSAVFSSRDFVKAMERYAAQTSALAEVTIGQDGKASFSQLELGLYLAVQDQAAKGYKELKSFVASVPYYDASAKTWQLEVNASPKPGTLEELETEPKTEAESETESETRKPPEKPTEKPTEKSKAGGGGTLPQTGQLWWPVPVLVLLGAVLVLAGLFRRRHSGTGPAR